MTMYRQGDLLLVLIHEAPRGEKHSSLAILPSPITGHTHRLDQGEVWRHEPENGDVADRASFFAVIPEGGANLLHEEHGTIPLPAGTYAIIRQREVNGYVQD